MTTPADGAHQATAGPAPMPSDGPRVEEGSAGRGGSGMAIGPASGAGGGSSAGDGGTAREGLTARIVRIFLGGHLSLLFLVASLLLGALALAVTPREEEPQIVVPVADVFVQAPGLPVAEVEKLVAQPLESILREIDGVEYVYSMSRPGLAIVTVRFYVGEDRERSLVKLQTKVDMNKDRAPGGVTGWIIKPVEIDDVPIVTLTLVARDGRTGEHDLRRLGEEMLVRLEEVANSARSSVVGGSRRVVRVLLDPARLAARGLTPLDLAMHLGAANVNLPAGRITRDNREVLVQTGPFLRSAAEVGDLVVGVHAGLPVYVRDVAQVVDGPGEPVTYTRTGFGPAGGGHGEGEGELPSVTVAISKRKGTNAVVVAREVLARVDGLKRDFLPAGVDVLVTRDYGRTADEKVDELVEHLMIAIATIVVLLAFALGVREAIIVALAVPVVMAITLLGNLIAGYTINRVTLFALILSLGLLVDDPIVDVENIHRHFALGHKDRLDATVEAVDEVRPPTILATFAVIVSFLPMFFITGMMGPYMRPMPLNISLAMLMSLVVAFTITPWASYKLLGAGHVQPSHDASGRKDSIYHRVVRPLLSRPWAARAFLGSVGLAFGLSLWLAASGRVPLKMLPFDNKSELLLLVDLPAGATLEATDRVARAVGDTLRTVPEVTSYQTYVGTAAPIDFNGLVRHYYLREVPQHAQIRVNLAPKDQRGERSHSIALRLRPALEAVGRRLNATLSIVEVPPGPPVLQTLVGEVYGPREAPYEQYVDAAHALADRFRLVAGVADTYVLADEPQERLGIETDREKAALHGISVDEIARTLSLALGGSTVGTVHLAGERSPLPLVLQLPRDRRSSPEDLGQIQLRPASGAAGGAAGGLAAGAPTGMRAGGPASGSNGAWDGSADLPQSGGSASGPESPAARMVPLSELVRFERAVQEPSIYRKNLRRVAYVTADVVGRPPADAVLELTRLLARSPLPAGFTASLSGEGEWKITLDVFRDLGLAFGVALLGIYVLLVGQTGSLVLPLVIMIAIPLTMIGIFPGFWLLNLLMGRMVGVYADPIWFTATGMIGMIALAGIVVRNSIILIDFIEAGRARGLALDVAILEAGAVRTRPILLTAGAALLGSWVITLDPIFSGLAWSFIFGIFASTAFTLLVVPLVYQSLHKRNV